MRIFYLKYIYKCFLFVITIIYTSRILNIVTSAIMTQKFKCPLIVITDDIFDIIKYYWILRESVYFLSEMERYSRIAVMYG